MHDMPPRGHVGIATPDLDRSLAFYQSVLGLRLRGEPQRVEPTDPRAPVFAALFGSAWQGVRMAMLERPGGPDVELFEFSPRTEGSRGAWPVAWQSPGVFHVSFGCADVDATLERVEVAGGRRVCDPQQTSRYRLVYALDPFGTVIELLQAVGA